MGKYHLTARERFTRIFYREEVDRPFRYQLGYWPETLLLWQEPLSGRNPDELFRTIGLDLWWIERPLVYAGKKRYFLGEEADYLGITASIYAGTTGDSNSQGPLKGVSSVDEVEAYPWPSIDDFDGSDLERQLGIN